MTAFEELKVWCERYVPEGDYKIVPESTTFAQAIYFTANSVGFVCFNRDGSVCDCGGCDEEGMEEHLFDLAIDEEKDNEPEPMPTSIGGMMVRKMIAAYEVGREL